MMTQETKNNLPTNNAKRTKPQTKSEPFFKRDTTYALSIHQKGAPQKGLYCYPSLIRRQNTFLVYPSIHLSMMPSTPNQSIIHPV
jgi:hypothetical protein